MKKLRLFNGQYTLLDDSDYEQLSKHSWTVNKGYARRTVHVGMVDKKQRTATVMMHRVIMGEPKKYWVDHINRDRLDNRRSNLRLTDKFGNSRNKSIQKNNTSGCIGVSKTRGGKWKAYIMSAGTRYNLGTFDNLPDAKAARDKAAQELHGDFAKLNK